MGSSQPLLDPLVGSRIGRYVVQARIGEGGMGTVYRAEQTPLGRPVALKVIHRAFVSDPKVVSRFLREAKIACQLTNPHTVTIFDFGNEEGVLYLAMELLQGQSLHERLCRGPVEPVRAAEIAAQVCRSLTEAHKKGIIHRDLKPDNIFLSSADDGALLCKVLDYGLARVMSSDESPGGIQATLTQIGTIVGTPIYMSPEQARGKKLDARTDLYSMGVVLFEMLSGVAPFLDEDAVVVLGKHIRDPVPRIAETGARVAPPAALQVLVDKLLEKEPSKRPPDAAWVFQELRAYLAQVAGRSTRLPAIEETSPPVHAPDAPPPRISPPDAASGVQPRMDEAPASDADREWEVATETESRRSRAAAAVAAPPQAMALHPTLQMESPESLALSQAPTTVPVAPRRSAPAPTRPPSGPPGTAPGPSLTTLRGAPAAGRRVPLVAFAIGIPVLAAIVGLVVAIYGGGGDGRPVRPVTTATAVPARGPSGGEPTAVSPTTPAAPVEPRRPGVATGGAPSAGATADEPPTPDGMRPRDVPPGGWTGLYRTTRGNVELTERIAAVTGRFGAGGRLQGRPSGSVLRFAWIDGADGGNGVLRCFEDEGGRVVFRGSWGRDDPDGVRVWPVRERPAPRVRVRPTKRPSGDGLVIGNDSIFGDRRRDKRR